MRATTTNDLPSSHATDQACLALEPAITTLSHDGRRLPCLLRPALDARTHPRTHAPDPTTDRGRDAPRPRPARPSLSHPMPPDQRRGGTGRLSTSSSSPSLRAVPVPGSASASASDAHGVSEPSSPLPSPPPLPLPSPNPSATPSSSSRPSLLSRLSRPLSLPLPLRNRNRSVVDFHVRCDEPYRKFKPGDSVRGCVVLVLVKPLRITHLVVSLHGYVRVLKDPASVAKAQLATALPQGGSADRPQYHGNGLASLFQDEQVLSSEGRIEPGKYEFGFDLVFPDKELPSSIDFERGTISYMITATITRPTTIAPTSTCDRRVMLAQKIDVGMLAPPRPRTIFLEPISKRTRRKKSAAQERAPASAAPDINDVASEADSVDRSVVTDDSGREAPADHRAHIPSDMRSELSGESGRSLSTAVSRADLAQLSQVGSSMTPAAKQQVVDDKTITATIELLRGGCLPGDTVSVRITVHHVKRVKSMTGVIVTLFRQGKMDTSPMASRFADMSKEEARRLEKEETYPRSRTGLGGLSLSSSNSTSVFRKDLDQNAAPLIIDPATLQASVTVSVRLPDDAFPTIKGVPGDMISFKYQVEIVVDLGGRLASQLQGGQSSSSRYGPYGTTGSEPSGSTYAPRRAANIADTAQLRREKGVISVSMETVVGTMDSSRGRKPTGRSPESRTVRIHESDDDEAIHADMGYTNGQSSYYQSSPQPNDYQFTPPPGPPPAHPHLSAHPTQGTPQRDYLQTNGYHDDAAPSYIPPPQVPDEHSMTEKERIRQAETRLLPSQPGATGSCPSAADDIYEAEDTPRLPRPEEPNAPSSDGMAAGPSAPTEEELAAGRPVEDKQELERRRLMSEACAPPEFPDDMDRRGEGPSSREQAHADAEPSAPVLGDDGDDFVAAAGPPVGVEQLPAYER
ncbi:pH-response regulator protein palF/RIM8 [Tolypocladium paradoxum]|uniref:pH-response regulator protein palF/RIM8 n=1 Tax=Tolypocladium paradoxum TaxID=94208 RepID=A0A2S4LAK9_9HYPO|nr:pH-response regulator protein palF/RIM8 [Tolypocladium paradoxum]